MVMNPILSRPVSSAEVSRHLVSNQNKDLRKYSVQCHNSKPSLEKVGSYFWPFLAYRTMAEVREVRQPYSPWGRHAGCHCSSGKCK